ncbi:hypothetical protein [Streptacidiphilus sp. P02-A3a]|uniref:hypothetical protein n=1 Tax=Streptacidiphilus sp. P02-A3a TaxID=2704468 RepID=UPI001CDC1AF2|nr:hypothetical protein [Streptacidiphilus sp. P02-A3a]
MDHASGVTVVLTAADHAVASWMLLAFVVTFVLTRLITRLIRAGRGPFGNVEVGGTHVHHEVYGIMAMLVSGAVEFAYRPQTPGAQILGALFGAGAALTLDEFALWLHLEDVYWAREGRKSVDAVFVAAAAGLFLLIGGNPFSTRTARATWPSVSPSASTCCCAWARSSRARPLSGSSACSCRSWP